MLENSCVSKQATIAGVDEAGRGPLAGPVVAAAVILSDRGLRDEVADSKKLTGKQRDSLFDKINESAQSVGVGIVSPEEIDRLNILQATMLAMRHAVNDLSISPHEVWIDGNRCPELVVPAKAIVGGDNLIPEISAASIIAKVTRDRIMLNLHRTFPQYGFDSHKGYPTKQHREALRVHGVSSVHRRSFKPVRDCIENADSVTSI
ncbi:MAG: ribonuclease HII [Gammaproteobacteria bacterium]